MSNTNNTKEWLDTNVVQVGDYFMIYPIFLLKRLLVNLMTMKELKTNPLLNLLDTKGETITRINSLNVPPTAKIVITTDEDESGNKIKKIYPNQYYYQGLRIDKLDIDIQPSSKSSLDSINLVVSYYTISNLQYYNNSASVNYNLYMYGIHANTEELFSTFFSEDNKNNIMKYTNIHLLDIFESYYLVKYLCNEDNTTGKNIYLHAYSHGDLHALIDLFENEKNIEIGKNVTIILSIGWITLSTEIEALFLKYMNLIVHMTEYKMRHGTIQFKIDAAKVNKEQLSKNNLYFDCVQVLFDEYITKKNPNAKNYRACLLAVQNLKRLNSTMEEIKKIDANFEDNKKEFQTKIDKVDKQMTTYYSTKASLNTKYKTLDKKIDQKMDKEKLTEELTKELTKELKKNLELSLNKQMTTEYSDISKGLNKSISDLNDKIFNKSNESDTAFSISLQELYGQFQKMEMDNKYRFNILYIFLFLCVVFSIFLISVRTSIKKK